MSVLVVLDLFAQQGLGEAFIEEDFVSNPKAFSS
jgi:hypothetical protein